MKYNIITIGDMRRSYKENIRETVELEEVFVPSTNGSLVDLKDELYKRGIHVTPEANLSVGEVGVWLSVFDCWQWSVGNNEELIVFEDDAIPAVDFMHRLNNLYPELPPDYDFMCLWVPDNQLVDYLYDVDFDSEGVPVFYRKNKTMGTSNYDFGATYIANVYNGYGAVAQLYSPKGAQFFIERTLEAGIRSPVDCFLYLEAHAGRCKGFAPQPRCSRIVSYDWPVTTIHTTERFE